MKKLRKIFYAMGIVGMITFMVMMGAMLFVDFRPIEVAIPFIIGCVGLNGELIIKREMKKRSNRIRVRKMARA